MLHFYCRQGGSSFADIKKLISRRIESITRMNGCDQKKHHPFCDNETIRLWSWSQVDDALLPREVGERVLKGLPSNSGLYFFLFLLLLKWQERFHHRDKTQKNKRISGDPWLILHLFTLWKLCVPMPYGCERGCLAPPVAQLVLAGRAGGAPLIYCRDFYLGLIDGVPSLWVCVWVQEGCSECRCWKTRV